MLRLLVSRRSTVTAIFGGMMFVLAACSGDAVPSGEEVASPSGDLYAEACAEIAEAMTTAYPDFTLVEDEGRYSLGDVEGSGCRTLVAGTAEELPSFVEVSQTLGMLLRDAGWMEDALRAADGPTGTLTVYERDGQMAAVSAGASPEDPAACAPDEVISTCFERLDPAQIEVQGSITVAARGAQ